MKILLISGHGAGDSGACATIKGVRYKEAEETIVMVKKIKKQLSKYNVAVDVYPTDRNAYEDAKKGCLKVDFSKYDYVLEIHFNACVNDLKGNGKTTGTEAHITTIDNTKKVENKILENLSELGFKNRGIKKNNWTVIYKAKTKGADSCLLEVCFIDDADDMKIYVRNKDNIAKAIADGIAKTYSLKKVESKKDNNKKDALSIAKSFSKSYVCKYKVNKETLNMRLSADCSNDKNIVCKIKKNSVVSCYGYYTRSNGVDWLLCSYNGKVGYCCAKYLKKK